MNLETRHRPIGHLTPRQRFDGLIAPRSTIIQTSAAHTGTCEDPAAALEHFLEAMVAIAVGRRLKTLDADGY